MTDAAGRPDRMLLLGGSSAIGVALCQAFAAGRPAQVVLAGRPSQARADAASALERSGLAATQLDVDLLDIATHEDVIGRVFSEGDVDIAIVAFGSLGGQDRLLDVPDDAVSLANVNFTGPMSLGLRTVSAMTRQGRGTLIVLSSVAALTPRPANFVYGATKAGLDAFFLGLASKVRDHGVGVHVVRPGFVRTRMTSGMRAAPFASTPEQVARDVVDGVHRGATVVWSPRIMQAVGVALRVLPRSIINRMKA